MKKKSRFVVSFVAEVEHDGETDPGEVQLYVEGAAADMVDYAYDKNGRKFESHGVKITDTLNFTAVAE